MMKKTSFPWYLLAACVLIGAAAGFVFSTAKSAPPTAAQNTALPITTRSILPSSMTLSGDYVLCAAQIPDPQSAALCSGLPAGSIVLGADPDDGSPTAWDGASAQIQLNFPEVTVPAFFASIRVSWPLGGEAGMFSPQTGKTAALLWDGVTIWNKSTRDAFGLSRFYAVKDGDVFTSAAVNSAGPFTLTIQVPAGSAWSLSQIEVAVFPQADLSQPGSLRGIAYSPYRDCQSPDWGPYPSEPEVREDMARMMHTSNGIRTYSTLGINGQIPLIARNYGLKVCVGVWLGREKDQSGKPIKNKNREEIEALVVLANNPELDLECVIIGNEVLLRNDLSESEYIAYIREIKSRIPPSIPISAAEVYDLVLTHPRLAAELDWLMIHIYPYWHAQPINSAVSWTIDRYQEVQAAFPGQKVVIGETGWPSGGTPRGASQPSLETQRIFFYQFLVAAEHHQVDYYFFDTFDEMWKREGGVGSHWGYLYSDRTGKHELQSLLIPAQVMLDKPVYLPAVMRIGSLLNNLAGWLLDPQRRQADAGTTAGASAGAEADAADFYIYENYSSEGNHFAPSGWMGDAEDLRLYECERTDLNSPETSIKIEYNPQGALGWAGIYWQEPAGNWGSMTGKGYNLDDSAYLRFSARGLTGGEKVRFFMGGIWGTVPDTQQPVLNTDVITLSDSWQEYSIDLRGRDLSRVVGGFGFNIDRCLAAQSTTFFIDNMRYELSGDPGAPVPTPTPSTPFTIAVYRDKDGPGNHFTPSGWMGDLGDIALDECWRSGAHTGSTAIRVAYAAQKLGPSTCGGSPCGWTGVYWQDPPDSWGTQPGGYNLSKAAGLSFWARGEVGGELVTFKAGGMNCGAVAYPETFCPAVTLNLLTELTSSWQKYTIPIPAGTNLTRVMGPFVWSAASIHNPSGIVFYLDDIQFIFNQPAASPKIPRE